MLLENLSEMNVTLESRSRRILMVDERKLQIKGLLITNRLKTIFYTKNKKWIDPNIRNSRHLLIYFKLISYYFLTL